MKSLHRIGAAIVGAIVALATIGAVYNQFSPGGALSGTWNSQNVNVAAGAPFIAGTLPAGNGGTGSAFVAFAGPNTTVKTLTLPNANATLLSDANAVTLAQGGTGLTSAADDTTIVSSGSAWVATAVPNCGDSSHALAYSTASNAFACQSVTGSGATLSTGTWTTTFTTGCTTQPTQDWSYSQVGSGAGSMVTIASSALFNCTSNATTFTSASGSVPAAIRPSRTVFFPLVNMTDNSTQGSACLVLDANGTLRYVVEEVTTSRCGVAAWTNSGSKQINMSSGAFGASVFSYRID